MAASPHERLPTQADPGASAVGQRARTDPWRVRSLVSADWLLNVVRGGEQAAIVDVSGSTARPSRYDDGHIPGAICISTESVESDENEMNLFSGAELGAVFAAHGIRGDALVVVTSEDMQAAARMWMALRVSGVADAVVLDGGNAEWRRRAFPMVADVPCAAPADAASWAGRAAAVRRDLVVAMDAVPDAASDDTVVVSTRSYAEFCGQVSGYPYIEAKGEIPGAVWGRCGSDAHHMEDYTDEHGCMKPLHVVFGWWAHVGATPERHVIFYCGTGWRASYAMLIADLLGYARVSLFDGGWFVWSRQRRE